MKMPLAQPMGRGEEWSWHAAWAQGLRLGRHSRCRAGVLSGSASPPPNLAQVTFTTSAFLYWSISPLNWYGLGQDSVFPSFSLLCQKRTMRSVPAQQLTRCEPHISSPPPRPSRSLKIRSQSQKREEATKLHLLQISHPHDKAAGTPPASAWARPATGSPLPPKTFHFLAAKMVAPQAGQNLSVVRKGQSQGQSSFYLTGELLGWHPIHSIRFQSITCTRMTPVQSGRPCRLVVKGWEWGSDFGFCPC